MILNAIKQMERAGGTVVPGADFGPGGGGYVRLCFGRAADVVHEGMRRLSNYLEHHHA